jgi:hypothetical protein
MMPDTRRIYEEYFDATPVRVLDIRLGVSPEEHQERDPLIQADVNPFCLQGRQDDIHPKGLVGECAHLANLLSEVGCRRSGDSPQYATGTSV